MREPRTLPPLCYVGDHVVGVVSACHCPEVEVDRDTNVFAVASPPHESHDIVPPRQEDDLPEGVGFEDYKRWCRMFAAAPKMLAACKTAAIALGAYATGVPILGEALEHLNAAIREAEGS